MALVSDAGTPLINDPGQLLIRECYKNRICVVPLPGPCAAIVALSASGLSCNSFCYEGFLPPTSLHRLKKLKSLREESRTIIFYESSHRIENSLQDIKIVFGPNKKVSVAKELTKLREAIITSSIQNILVWFRLDSSRYKGEWVIILEGMVKKRNSIVSSLEKQVYSILKKEMSTKKSIELVAKICKTSKNNLYKYIMKKKNDNRQKII